MPDALKRRLAWGGLLALVLCSAGAALLTPYDPMRTDGHARLLPPHAAHPLGTDAFGRDVLSRVLYGGRHTLWVAAAAALIAATGGMVLGLLCAAHPAADRLLRVLLDALLAMPALLVAFVVLTLLGRGDGTLMLATGLAQVAAFARVVRGALLNVQHEPYVEAARAVGAGRLRVLLRHVLPNARTVLLAYAGTVFVYCLLNSAGLSFLGLGSPPGTPDWGVMLAEGRSGFRSAPWVGIAPGVMMTLTVLCVNALVDAITAPKR